MKILLVDDSKTLRNIQKNTLKSLGYADVAEAATVAEALASIANGRPDLMLVDWNMTKIDGISLIREVREKDQALPIIMVTTHAEKSRVMEAVKAGVTNFVVKPFTAEVLAEKINQTMAKFAPVATA